jgi:DNA polymerase III alpha subunit (gram-positive type)
VAKWVLVDVESDGPCPGIDMYSMVCFGAVVLGDKLDNSFYGQTSPISEKYIPDALAISGFTRTQHEKFDDPKLTMDKFAEWLKSINEPIVLVSDNPAFDWQFVNYYLHKYTGNNPFGFSARRIGDMYAGIMRNSGAANNWKKYRKTKHTHNPVDDAKGNAEALLVFRDKYNFKVPT